MVGVDVLLTSLVGFKERNGLLESEELGLDGGETEVGLGKKGGSGGLEGEELGLGVVKERVDLGKDVSGKRVEDGLGHREITHIQYGRGG